ncbi:uncharacterized protein LOC144142439 isoform X2 [Haemaphysalis longicornis]
MASVQECEQLGDLKAVVRALLIVDKEPPTLLQFLRAYRESEGHEFPYQRFGFTNAVSFLRSMPDTVQLLQIGARDGDVRLLPTVTRDIQHVQKLVSGQKDPLGRCSRPPVYFQPISLGSSSGGLLPPPPQPQVPQRPLALRPLALRPRAPRPLAPRQVYSVPATILAKIKQNIRVLLQDNWSGVDLDSLTRDYQHKFGCPLSFVPFGCSTLVQFLTEKLTDTVRMEQNSKGAYRVTLLRDGRAPVAATTRPPLPLRPPFPPRPPFPAQPRPPGPGQWNGGRFRPVGTLGPRTAMGTPVRQSFQPWQQRTYSTYGARVSPAVRVAASPWPIWWQPLVPLPLLVHSPLWQNRPAYSRGPIWPLQAQLANAVRRAVVPARSPLYPPAAQCSARAPRRRRSPPPESPEEDWEAEIVPCTPEAKPSAVAEVHAGGDTRANGTGPLSPQLVSNIKKGLTGNDQTLVDHGFGRVGELVPHCADIVGATRPTPEGELMISPREQPPSTKPPVPHSEPPALPRDGHQQRQRPQGPPLGLQHMIGSREQPPSTKPPVPNSEPPALPRDGHQQPQRPQGPPLDLQHMICPREQPPSTKPPVPHSEPPGLPRDGHQQHQRPEGPPLDLQHMMAVVEKILRVNCVPPRGRGRGTRAASHQPGATTPAGSRGLTLAALQKAFEEATGRRLEPGQYGFSVESFVSYLCFTLPAHLERPEPTGQFLIRLGASQERQQLGTVAVAPSEVADLLASPPQPRSRPWCVPDNVWGSVEPRGQSSATGMQEPGIQPGGRAQLVPAVPDVLARRAVPLQPCPPLDRALEEEGTERPSSRASQPPAAAPGAEGVLQLSLDPIGQQPLAPPVDLEGPFQLCDKLGEESTLVYVTRVYSPHHFYVQCVDEDTKRTLQWLTVHLEVVSRGWGVHQNNVQTLTVGMPCAAPYTSSDGVTTWLRAIIYAVDAQDERDAVVFFVDYGYASRVRRTDLHPLKNEVVSIPAQAIRATMDVLEPIGAGWTPEATEDFVRLLGNERTVVCTLLEHRGSICSVHLCNTCVDPEVHIPDAMVDLGHAASVLTDEELPEEPVGHVLPLAASAPAASAPSSLSLTGWTTPSSAPSLPEQPASPPMSHAVEPVYGVSGSDVLRQQLDDTEQHLGALRCLERQDLPLQPAEAAADLRPCLRRSPSPKEPVFSLLPVTSGADFQGRLDALCSKLAPSEGSTAVEEEPEEHVTRPPLSPERVVQWSGEDFGGRRLRALREIASNVSDIGDAQPAVHGLQATVKSCAPVPAFREAPRGRHPLGWRSSTSLAGGSSPEPSTGVTQQPHPGLPARGPVDFELDFQPHAPPLKQQGSAASGGAAWPRAAPPALPPEEDEEVPSWLGNPITWPELLLNTVYPPIAVKPEYLRSGHCLLVVNLHREPYVTSANLCQLLGWPLDTLAQEALHVTFRTTTLHWHECVRFFYQMASYRVPGVEGPFGLAPEVTFFRLENVIDILNLFNNTDSLLRVEVQRVLQAFDPASQYWTVGPPLLQAGTSADPGAGSGGAGPP